MTTIQPDSDVHFSKLITAANFHTIMADFSQSEMQHLLSIAKAEDLDENPTKITQVYVNGGHKDIALSDLQEFYPQANTFVVFSGPSNIAVNVARALRGRSLSLGIPRMDRSTTESLLSGNGTFIGADELVKFIDNANQLLLDNGFACLADKKGELDIKLLDFKAIRENGTIIDGFDDLRYVDIKNAIKTNEKLGVFGGYFSITDASICDRSEWDEPLIGNMLLTTVLEYARAQSEQNVNSKVSTLAYHYGPTIRLY
jgi:hypothetical protein